MLMASEVTATPSPPHVGKLDSLRKVRLEMTKIYKEARIGTLETQEATRLCFLLVNIAKLIESSDLERRLEQVEAQLESGEAKNGKN
jgi:hypothetical protein